MSRRSDSGRFLFGCFKPGVADRDDGLVRSRSAPLKGSDAKRSVLAYIAFDDEGNKVGVLQRIVPCRMESEVEVGFRPPKDGTSKRLVRATKAAFLDMSLVQKKRNPKKKEEPSGQLRKKANQILRLASERSEKEPGNRDFDVSSSSWSSFAATSLSSASSTRSLSPGSISNSVDNGASKLLVGNGQDRPLVPVRKLSPSADTPLNLILLLALVVLIFWGKVCAIVCTSACLVFYLPSWAPQSASSVDSAEYKKRVIMEGPLRRQQRPRGLQRWSSS